MSSYRVPIMFLVILITVIGVVSGYKYYRYTQEDPNFCSSCHLMQEAVKSWQRSGHKQFECQKCHRMNILEQNKLLVAFVLNPKGKIKEKHGKVNTWLACKECHRYDVAQGSITRKNSYGHARHVFMQGISCEKCHNGKLHEFNVAMSACLSCHKDKIVHGMGMKKLECLNCHSYSESSPKMVTPKRCLHCHKDVPEDSPMSGLSCFDCHKPHGKLKMESKDCLGTCHGNESRVGQHGLHMTRAGMKCLDCHRPHNWMIGKKQAKGLCDRCHELRSPARFIY